MTIQGYSAAQLLNAPRRREWNAEQYSYPAPHALHCPWIRGLTNFIRNAITIQKFDQSIDYPVLILAQIKSNRFIA